MAKGSGIIRKVSGKVGDLIYSVRGGQQIIRGVATSTKNRAPMHKCCNA